MAARWERGCSEVAASGSWVVGLAQKPAKAWVSAEVTTTHRRTQPRPPKPVWRICVGGIAVAMHIPEVRFAGEWQQDERESLGIPRKEAVVCWRSKIELILLILL